MRQVGKLNAAALSQIRRYFRIKSIYHSNAIEGNKLDVGETRQVVEHGLTITGKSLRDQAEARNLKQALDFLETLASPDQPITESDVRQIHFLVLQDIDNDNAGRYRNVPVEISGSQYRPPAPESVAGQMQAFSKWLSSALTASNDNHAHDAILYAAVAHTWLVYIHPFIDGNGRVARLVMNLMLMRYGYPIAIITKADRERYYDALETSQSADLSPFIALVIECVGESLDEYEQAAKEQREQQEWATELGSSISRPAMARLKNEYEVWKSAMELLRGHFRQAAESIQQSTPIGNIHFKDFGMLEFDKYMQLKQHESAKRTWFFRVDFIIEDTSARYLFFFGYPNQLLKKKAEVTLHLSREDPPKSFNYQKLDRLTAPNIPSIVEIGYHAQAERFVSRGLHGTIQKGKIENIGKKFFEQVISCHFQT